MCCRSMKSHITNHEEQIDKYTESIAAMEEELKKVLQIISHVMSAAKVICYSLLLHYDGQTKPSS